jgi:hypothetical protein
MMNRHRAFLTAAALAVCAAVPLIASELVPLHGSFKGTYSLTPLSLTPPVFAVNGTATGTARHLGKATLLIEGQATVDETGNVIPVPGTSKATLVAANGDKVFADYRWRAELSLPGTYSLSGHYTVTGGTGRYEGATGTGTYSGQLGLLTGQFAGSLDGDISAPGAK